MKKLIPLLFSLLISTTYAQQSKRVLFLGNSYTANNNLPVLIADIALSKGDTLNHDRNTPGGSTLQNHYFNGVSVPKIQQGNWDYVVLQEQSQGPAFNNYFLEHNIIYYTKRLDSLRNLADSCGETMFFMTWGRKNGDPVNCVANPAFCTYASMQARLRTSYLRMANRTSSVVSPVGIAWRDTRNHHPNIELYAGDGSHPTLAGSYLAACTFYASIFHKSPIGASYPTNLASAIADTLQLRAHHAVFDSLAVWNIDTTRLRGNINSISWQSGFTFKIKGATHNADTAWWEPGDGSSSAYNDSVIYTYSSLGVYIVQLQLQRGCEILTIKKELTLDPASLQENKADFASVFYYDGWLNVELREKGSAQLEVWSLNGQRVLKQTLHSTESKVALGSLAKGVYIIGLQQGQQFHSQKIVIME